MKKLMSIMTIGMMLFACSSKKDIAQNHYDDGIYYNPGYTAPAIGTTETPLASNGEDSEIYEDYYDPGFREKSKKRQSEQSSGTTVNNYYGGMGMMHPMGMGYGMMPGWSFGMGYGMGYGMGMSYMSFGYGYGMMNPWGWGFYDPWMMRPYGMMGMYRPWGWGFYDPYYAGFYHGAIYGSRVGGDYYGRRPMANTRGYYGGTSGSNIRTGTMTRRTGAPVSPDRSGVSARTTDGTSGNRVSSSTRTSGSATPTRAEGTSSLRKANTSRAEAATRGTSFNRATNYSNLTRSNVSQRKAAVQRNNFMHTPARTATGVRGTETRSRGITPSGSVTPQRTNGYQRGAVQRAPARSNYNPPVRTAPSRSTTPGRATSPSHSRSVAPSPSRSMPSRSVSPGRSTPSRSTSPSRSSSPRSGGGRR
jgi:hypothetical protein